MLDIQNILTQPKDDQIIWQYLNFNKFFHLIIEKKLLFTRVDKLDDKTEGKPNDNYNNFRENILNEITNNKQHTSKIRKMETENVEKVRRTAFINCWCCFEKESFPHRKLYSPGKFGIAIKTTFKKLKNSIKSEAIQYGLIKYDKPEELCTISNNFFTKSKYYEFENELRLIVFERKQQNSYYEVKIDISNLFDEIVLDNNCYEWFLHDTRKLLNSVFNSQDFEKKVIKSKIKDIF